MNFRQKQSTHLVCAFQRSLIDATEGLSGLRYLNWSGSADYALKQDGQELTTASCKKYLEDLLTMTRRGLEMKERTHSSSSVASIMSDSEKAKPMTTEEEDDDIRYYEMYFETYLRE